MCSEVKFNKYNEILKEEDFYPPEDNRYLKSNVKDINGGDTFIDYSTYIFELYEHEDYYEN